MAVDDNEALVMQVALQPFAGHPLHGPVTFPVRICFLHLSHHYTVRSIPMDRDGSYGQLHFTIQDDNFLRHGLYHLPAARAPGETNNHHKGDMFKELL